MKLKDLVGKNRYYTQINGDNPCLNHEVVIVGYNDKVKAFIVLNSWGSAWGNGGYFNIPYIYMNCGLVQQLLTVVKNVTPEPPPIVHVVPKPTMATITIAEVDNIINALMVALTALKAIISDI